MQVISAGQRLSLAVDDNVANSVSNAGRRSRFDVADKQLLYIGGLDDERRQTAVDEFHVRDATSFKGACSGLTENENSFHRVYNIDPHQQQHDEHRRSDRATRNRHEWMWRVVERVQGQSVRRARPVFTHGRGRRATGGVHVHM